MKEAAGKHVYLLANLYNPAAYEWAWLNCYLSFTSWERSYGTFEVDVA